MSGTDGAVVVERVETLDEVREDWERLEAEADHPFATWDWVAGWWRRLGEGDLYCFNCRGEDGGVAAILPLFAGRRGPFRLARFIGEGDLRGPVCGPGARCTAAAGLRQVVGTGAEQIPLLVAERLPGGQGWGERIGARRLATHPDPVLPLRGVGWEDFLASRSPNFRQQVRRRERKLVEEHGLEFRLSEGEERFDEDFSTLVRLHAQRWEGGSSGVFAGERGEFQREFAAAARARGRLRLWIAEVDGEPAAAWYGWRFANQEWYYQAGRDPRHDDLSLGFVLLAHTVRAAAEDGVDAYRFLDGGESYKWRFAEGDLEAETVALGRGLSGRLGALAAAAAARAPSGARGRIAR